MNRPIRGLAVGCLLLFVALLLNASYVQYYWAGDLDARADNTRVRVAEFSRERGSILVGREQIADSVPSDDEFKYQRRYRQPVEYAHVSGFYSYQFASTGVEADQNGILSGSDSRLFVNSLVDLLGDTEPRGGSVQLTLSAAAQEAAFAGVQALGQNTKAAVVALQPATGKVLAMVSNPTFDPSRVASHDLDAAAKAFRQLSDDEDEPLLNRAIQETYPPGSTFKLVTAAAALESGLYDPDTQVQGGTGLPLPNSTRVLPNDSGGDCGGERITLTQALRVSCNVAFGSIGIDLGAEALIDQAEKFGFGARYLSGLSPQAPSEVGSDLDGATTALSAIGQFDVRATPLQMALVTATIANNGQGEKPYLIDEVRAPDLSVLDKLQPEDMPDRAMSARNAGLLTSMMVEVVATGTGRPAAIPGVTVAGKTGTAQSSEDRPPYAWFVAFAPAEKPEVAVAVLVEDAGVERDAISGGGLAAPIARSVIEAVLNQ